jgi:hypothetical protein
LIVDVGIGRPAGVISAAGVLVLIIAAAAVPSIIRRQ